MEETRPGQYYEINQDERGSHILSPKDLCLVEYIPQLIEAGVDSLKVEGRTKLIEMQLMIITKIQMQI